MADEIDNVDLIIKEFADLYGLKILYGQLVRPYWIQDDKFWEIILAALDCKIKVRDLRNAAS